MQSCAGAQFYRLGVTVRVAGGFWEDGSVLIFIRVQLRAAGTAQEIRARPGHACFLFTSRSDHLIVHSDDVKTTDRHELRRESKLISAIHVHAVSLHSTELRKPFTLKTNDHRHCQISEKEI